MPSRATTCAISCAMTPAISASPSTARIKPLLIYKKPPGNEMALISFESTIFIVIGTDIGIAAHILSDTIDILLDGGVFEEFGPPLKPARPLAPDIHLCCFGLDFHPHLVEIESWSGEGCGFLRLSGNRQRKSQDKQCPNGPADSDADHIPQARSM